MNHAEFCRDFIGKRIDYDGVFLYQCVDLARFYAEHVLGNKIGAFGGSAYTGWLNTAWTFNELWEKVVYKKWLFPKQGDIIFFDKTTSNPYGHVAVVDTRTTMIEQNGGRGSGSGTGDDAIRFNDIRTCLGWYTLKKNDEVEKRVDKFVKTYGLKDPSKTEGYTQYETCIIISKVLKDLWKL